MPSSRFTSDERRAIGDWEEAEPGLLAALEMEMGPEGGVNTGMGWLCHFFHHGPGRNRGGRFDQEGLDGLPGRPPLGGYLPAEGSRGNHPTGAAEHADGPMNRAIK